MKAEEYAYHTPHVREDSLIVYGIHPQPPTVVSFSPTSGTASSSSSSSSLAPPENSVSITTMNQNIPQVNQSVYEVIFTRETPGKGAQQLFSLCRTPDLESATKSLTTFHSIIPVLSLSAPGLVNVDTLQDVCDYVNQFPNQTIAHVAAHFSFQVRASLCVCVSFRPDRQTLFRLTPASSHPASDQTACVCLSVTTSCNHFFLLSPFPPNCAELPPLFSWQSLFC